MVTRRDFLQRLAVACTATGAGVGHVAAEQPRDDPDPLAAPKATELAPSPEARHDEATGLALEPIRERHELPGLIGGWARSDGRLESAAAVGVRKLGAPALFQVNDQVHLGSDTKAMTATMIGTLVDEGKLGWSSTLAEVFPDRAKAIHAGYREVTLWQLLTHRAGLPANGPWGLLRRNRSTTEQRRSLMAGMLQSAPLTTPGTKYRYSNVGYALAGLMAEQVTGRSWEALMRQRLFEPLGMTTAGFGPPGTKGKVDQPWGHEPRPKKQPPFTPQQADNPPALGPAGTVHCTMADWARFAGLHLRAALGKPQLLKADTFRMLQTPPAGSDYAGGWLVSDRQRWTRGQALTHSGSNTLWYATVWIVPARDLVVLAATNAGGETARAACDEVIRALVAREETTRPR